MSDSKIVALQKAMHTLQQWDATEHTQHFFSDGMYCRLLFRPAGTLIIGKQHKKSHFYMVVKGRVLVTDGDTEPVDYAAPTILISKPGTKRAVLALEDSVCMTVHRTDKTDFDEIEAELIESDETALFDARNHQKRICK